MNLKNTVSLLLFFFLCNLSAQELLSPNGNLQLRFFLDESGSPQYSLKYKEQEVLSEGKMGFLINTKRPFCTNFKTLTTERNSVDESWQPVWGEQSEIRDHHDELFVALEQIDSKRRLNIRFRLFDDGLGFRYEFPTQEHLRHFIIKEEITEFNLAKDYKAFWLPGDYDTNEYPTTISQLSEIASRIEEVRKEPLAAKAFTPNIAVQTPLMLKSANGLYVNIHEAALINYSAMCLNVDDKNFMLSTHLTPDAYGNKGYIQTGTVSPWRTVVVSDDARDILSSNLILNLNPPCEYKETSWIKPMKYIGVWWEYFIGGGSKWSYSDNADVIIGETDYKQLQAHGRHGANTEHVKRYVDFAAEHGFDAVLVEGWNEGWEDNTAFQKTKIYSFTKAYPDFDVKELHRYSAAKGVKIMMHHETTSSVVDYERQIHAAFQFMNDNGYNSVKTGYVGRINPRGEYHDGQWMVNHYNYVAKLAADYKIMVNSHEAVRPTGLCRTFPNWLAQESARGTEFESFNGNSPEHTTILPFTRLMGGPMDYTPGIFQGNLSEYGNNKAKLSSTLAKQLALYVTMYSPLQMAADLPENYRRYADAFQFIKDIAVDWDASYILEAEPGDYISIARKAKGKEEWYIGAITDENERSATLDLSFLPKGKKFKATIYSDSKKSHWEKNPQSYQIKNRLVTSKTKLKIRLAPGGGAAVKIEVDSK